MATYTVPSQRGRTIPLQTQDRDHLPALDVVWANKYEGEMFSPESALEMEAEFYKGAPPQWLNFYWAEQKNSPFVKRDMYQDLRSKIIVTKTKRWSIAHIDLFHEPGSGGSTLAMQVLWDLRKELRCAKLLDSTTDTKATAQQVLRLFKAGGSENQNIVLLLLDNKYPTESTEFRENLEENLCDEIKANNITAATPVVIILNCIREATLGLADGTENLKLSSRLSVEEQNRFNEKHIDIITMYGNRHTHFYAFNIMQRNYDPTYVEEVCRTLPPLKKRRRSRKEQLLAFLALINSYVPGSYLPYDLCQNFIRRESSILEDFSLEPFTDFLVKFSTKNEDDRSEDIHIRMVHPMVAKECLTLLIKTGVTRSDIALKLLKELCRDHMPVCLVKTIKKLLTKRECRRCPRVTLDKFSKLILDIETEERPSMCVAVFKMALKTFTDDPYYPQALARFYYIERNDYEKAKHWAEMAIIKDERNSFIRDTLGQVHKNWLKNMISSETLPLQNREAYAKKILQHGKKATEVFQAEEEVALAEEAPAMQEHGMTSTSTIFNNRGIFGYMQVANIIFDHITTLHEEWPKILTKEISMHNFLNSYGRGRCAKYKSLITNLRDEVENKFEFFERYLLYSKPSIHKDEPKYFRPVVDECYTNFVTQSQNNKSALQILKERKASTFAGLLRSTQYQETELELITEQWKEIYLHSQSDAQIVQNYIVANVMLSQMNDKSTALRPLEELQELLHNLWTNQKDKRSPEFYLLVLLLFWPDPQQGEHNYNHLDIPECVRYMHRSFERTYKNYLRSRYLEPLFFLTTGHGLQKFVHKSHLDEMSINRLTKECEIPELRRIRGEVRNYKVFAVEGAARIEVSSNHPASVRGQGNVSFYLAFNIKGPVAYNIKYEQ